MRCRFFALRGACKVILNINTYVKIDRETKPTEEYYEPPDGGKLHPQSNHIILPRDYFV